MLPTMRRLQSLQLRWARTTHALGMGREYSEPFDAIGRDFRFEICALCECLRCWLTFAEHLVKV